MDMYFRLDQVTPAHIKQTLFIDGANCGTITLGHREYEMFGAILKTATEQGQRKITFRYDKIAWDTQGRYITPTTRTIIRIQSKEMR